MPDKILYMPHEIEKRRILTSSRTITTVQGLTLHRHHPIFQIIYLIDPPSHAPRLKRAHKYTSVISTWVSHHKCKGTRDRGKVHTHRTCGRETLSLPAANALVSHRPKRCSTRSSEPNVAAGCAGGGCMRGRSPSTAGASPAVRRTPWCAPSSRQAPRHALVPCETRW